MKPARLARASVPGDIASSVGGIPFSVRKLRVSFERQYPMSLFQARRTFAGGKHYPRGDQGSFRLPVTRHNMVDHQ